MAAGRAPVLAATWWEPDGFYPSNGGASGPKGSYQRQQYFFADRTLVAPAGAGSGDQNLNSVNVLAYRFNQVNRYMHIRAHGLLSTQVTGPTWRMKINLGALTILQFPDQTLIGSLVAVPWWMDAEIMVVTSGAAATLEINSGVLHYRNSNTTTAASTTAQAASLTSGAIDLTADQLLQFLVAFPTNPNVGNVCQQRKLIVEMLDGSAV